jgi:hypothetical protein
MRPQPGPKPDTTLLLKSTRHSAAPIQQQQQHIGHDSGGGVGKKGTGMRSGGSPANDQLLSGHVTGGGRSADCGDSGAAHLGKAAGEGGGPRAGAWLLEAPSGRAKYGRDR